MKTGFYVFCALLLFSCSSKTETNEIEQKFIQAGLIDVQTVDPSIQVDLVNSDSSKNYFRKNFYHNLKKCYVQKPLALKLKKAQAILKSKHPTYSLLIYDGARPRSVSTRMYNQLKNTPLKRYVANPEYGSMHNYGAAVDLVIVDEHGKELDMGPNPFRKNLAQLGILLAERKLKKSLSPKQRANQKMLRDVMVQAGMYPIKLEWWHFNLYEKKVIRKKYKIIE